MTEEKKNDWNKYQREYQKAHYKSLSVLLEPELVNEFKKKLQENDLSITQFFKNAIRLYLSPETIDSDNK